MATVYVPANAGPWLCDDDLIRCDGIFAGQYIEGVAHVDGVTATRRRRKRDGEHRGMVGAADAAPASYAKDK